MNNAVQATYPYSDEQGNLLYVKYRTVGPDDSKRFYYEHVLDGQLVKGLGECRRVLYWLTEVQKAIVEERTIHLVEGEKDVETLRKFGFTATTAPSTTEWRDEFTEMLNGADVALFHDYDKTGLKRRDMLCAKLYGNVKRLRVVNLPGLEYSDSHGKDITDWFEMGTTIEQLLDIVNKTPDYMPPGILRVVTIDKLLSLVLPEREMLLAPFLPSQGLAMLFAKRGVGKTFVALAIAYAVASGGTYLRWSAPKAKRVLYIDGEMPAVLMKERLSMIKNMSNLVPADGFLEILTPDLQEGPMPDLSTKEGRQALEALIENFDLIIIDNISCLFRSGSENESESWQEAQEWALDLRRRGKSVLFVHHAGKNGVQRGTSKREDILDAVISLKQPEDYKSEDGARFEVHFDKARHFSGEDARPFVAQLTQENGIYCWKISGTAEDEEIAKVATMRTSGSTIEHIVEKTGRTKSQVETLIKKAKEQRLL